MSKTNRKSKKIVVLLAIFLVFIVSLGLFIINYTPVGKFFSETFASNDCQNCGYIKYMDELDNRLGVVHASGDYPNKVGENFLYYGAKEAYRYGFRTIELWMTPNLCAAHVLNNVKSNGFYQTTTWCKSKTKTGFKSDYDSLLKLGSSSEFAYVLGLPYKTFIINIDSLNPAGLTQSKVQSAKKLATNEEKTILYNQVYEFSRYLLNQYDGTGKTFILVSTNELENRLTAYSGCNDNWQPGNKIACGDVEAGEINSKNAISFINTIQNAINDARNNTNSDVKVYQSAEVSHVVSKKEGVKSGLTEVLPYTNSDLYSYSAHEIRGLAIDKKTEDPYTLTKRALNKLEAAAPDSQTFGKKNIFIGEISLGETNANSSSYPLFSKIVDSALDWGVKYFVYWAFTDSNCDAFGTTTNSDCNGLWIVKPDGTNGKVYSDILSDYKTASYADGDVNRYGSTLFSIELDGNKINDSGSVQLDRSKDHILKITYKNTGNLPWSTKDGIFLSETSQSILESKNTYEISKIPDWKVVYSGGFQSFDLVIPKSNTKISDVLELQMTKSKLERFGEKTQQINLIFE